MVKLGDTVIILNWLDMLLTLAALGLGCCELNPLMRCVPLMVLYKAVAVPLLVRWLVCRQGKLAAGGLVLCAAAYGLLTTWHVYGWASIALRIHM